MEYLSRLRDKALLTTGLSGLRGEAGRRHATLHRRSVTPLGSQHDAVTHQEMKRGISVMNRKLDEELEYYATVFKKIRNKKYEFFVISKIVHLLNDCELEFTTQQLIRTARGRYLLDLYFPQLKFAIEVDEDHHVRDRQIDMDKERDKAVVDESSINIKRIAITGKTLKEVNSAICDVIHLIQQKKSEMQAASKFVPFVYGRKYETDFWLKNGSLSVSDDARFRTHVDVARLFGKNYEGHQRALIRLNNDHSVWFPKLYKNGDWNNELSSDGTTISMSQKSGGRFSSKEVVGTRYYVFAHHRDEFGKTYYAFKGIFELQSIHENDAKYSIVSNTITFDGKGSVTYN